jgi:hypothetical protein
MAVMVREAAPDEQWLGTETGAARRLTGAANGILRVAKRIV